MEKSEFLSGLQEEYRQWTTLLDEIGTSRMDRPDVAGGWSIKDIVAHLTGWRRRTVARLQAAGRGEPTPPSPWPAHLQTDDEINAWIYEANRERSVQEILDDSDQVFQQLLAAIKALPDEALRNPADHFPWLEGGPLTPTTLFGHFHEEHEPDMRAWLARVEQE
jgi:hypothetical protein